MHLITLHPSSSRYVGGSSIKDLSLVLIWFITELGGLVVHIFQRLKKCSYGFLCILYLLPCRYDGIENEAPTHTHT
eukprot:c31693_g1_i1 orf=3-227(-)